VDTSGSGVFNETFHLDVSHMVSVSFILLFQFQLMQQQATTLRLSLYSIDASVNRKFLGYIAVQLDSVALDDGGVHYFSKELQSVESPVVSSSLCKTIYQSISDDVVVIWSQCKERKSIWYGATVLGCARHKQL
jgi:hypothetical protein